MMLQPGLARKLAVALALALAAALALWPLTGHFDDSDSMLYRLIARHFAEGGRWLDPRYLPEVHPHYREHLPFGLWPWGLAARFLGEGSLAPLALLLSLGLLALVLRAGWRLFGFAAGLAALLVLACTESFFHYAAAPHLDRLLVLFSFASVAALLGPRANWPLAIGLAALATLVKGPFGLLPLVAVAVARGELLRGALATLGAALPAALFLAADKIVGTGTWYRGYLLDQLLASASGARADTGKMQLLLPFTSLAGRFWPGLPFALAGAFLGARSLLRRERTPLATLAGATIWLLALLCLPARKSWHHALVAWPLLALLAGAATGPFFDKSEKRARFALAALAAALAIALAGALGAAARFFPQSCVVPAALSKSIPRGAAVLVVQPAPDWKFIAALAEEYSLLPAPRVALPQDGPAFALVSEHDLPRASDNWHERARAEGWVLLESRSANH